MTPRGSDEVQSLLWMMNKLATRERWEATAGVHKQVVTGGGGGVLRCSSLLRHPFTVHFSPTHQRHQLVVKWKTNKVLDSRAACLR